jgi:hypothetical protein
MTDAGGDGRTVAALAGLAAVAGNVGGVLLLRHMPSAYRPARLDEWASAVVSQPHATVAAASAFALGLLALAAWALHLGRTVGTPLARAGAGLIAATALFDAAGATTPIVLAIHVGAGDAAVGRALLGLSLTLDALFNLGLGLGLVLVAAAAKDFGWKRGLLAVAGLASLPVAAQAVNDRAADLLAIAAPLWLAVIVTTSVSWLRTQAPREH